MATIYGTNVDADLINQYNTKGGAAYWSDRLKNTDNPNDVLFEMAYWMKPGGQGQGNEFVGAVQSDAWSMNQGKSWAEQAVESPSGQTDIYQTTTGPVAGAAYGTQGTADDLARAGADKFFYGTNIPTTGFNPGQISDFNSRLRTEIDAKNWKGANDAIFDIAWQTGKMFYDAPTDSQGGYGQGNKFVGMVHSDAWSLTDPDAKSWSQIYINSPNDEYPVDPTSPLYEGPGTAVRFGDMGAYLDVSTGGPTAGPTGGPTGGPIGKSGLLGGKIAYPFLHTAGIGQNLAYKPWMPQAWTADSANNYRGIPGGEDVRDLLYYYGGKTPMGVPGGWEAVNPPGKAKPVYPITRTPLFPTGKMSPGYEPVAPPVGPPVDPPVDLPPVDPNNPDTYGGLLSQYANRMGISPAGSGNYMYSVTGEPYKVTGVKGGTGPDRSYDSYRVPLTIYGGMGGPKEAFATRQSSAEGWDPSMNLWVTRGYESGGEKVPGFNINFADWSGTPGAYVGTEREATRPVLGGLLADPQNVDVTHPTYGATQRVPWAAADYGGPSWLTTPQASAFGTGSLANWGFNPIYAWNAPQQEYFTEDVIGYGAPIYRSNWGVPTNPDTGVEIPWGPNHPDWSGPD